MLTVKFLVLAVGTFVQIRASPGHYSNSTDASTYADLSTALDYGSSLISKISTSAPFYYTTKIVTKLTTYCPGPTKITHHGITYSVTKEMTLTITNCPCTVTESVQTATPTPSQPNAYSGTMSTPSAKGSSKPVPAQPSSKPPKPGMSSASYHSKPSPKLPKPVMSSMNYHSKPSSKSTKSVMSSLSYHSKPAPIPTTPVMTSNSPVMTSAPHAPQASSSPAANSSMPVPVTSGSHGPSATPHVSAPNPYNAAETLEVSVKWLIIAVGLAALLT